MLSLGLWLVLLLAGPAGAAEIADSGALGQEAAGGGAYALLLLGVFVGGLSLNLTPCVYPLVPITISFFGGRSLERPSLLKLNALCYWLGLVLMYTILGTAAALSGGFLGQALSSPLVVVFLTLVMLALAASMFGAWELRLPARLCRLGAENRSGLGGSLLMGFLLGLIAAPCLGPFVLGLFTHVAMVGKLAYGASLFFVLALGLGLPLTLLAFFSGALSRLPRAGQWMVEVRRVFGVVLLFMAVDLARPLLPGGWPPWLFLLAGLGGGLYLLWAALSGQSRKALPLTMALGLGLAGGILCWTNLPPESTGTEGWAQYTPELTLRAAQERRVVMLDFTAAWCPPCRQMESETFPHALVAPLLEQFVVLKVDITTEPSPPARSLMREWRVRGVPTYMFLDRQGRMLPEYMAVGFMDPMAFKAHLEKVLDAAGPL